MSTNIIKSYLALALAIFLAMTACGNKKDATKENIQPIAPSDSSLSSGYNDVSDMTLSIKANNNRPIKLGDDLSILLDINTKNYPEIDSINIKLGRSPYIIDTTILIEPKGMDASLQQIIVNTKNLVRLGSTTCQVIVFSSDKQQKSFIPLTIVAYKNASVERIKINTTIAHDPKNYTQGLLIDSGLIYESTGEYGKSRLLAYDPNSLKIKRELQLPYQYFGEGLALHNKQLYQLTWQEQKCFVYDQASFEKVREFNYSGEGWGLTSDGERLYMTDGSGRITIRDPKTFEILDYIQVYNGSKAVDNLNEMEWIDGKIWANIYTTNYIVIIDPKSGEIEKIIDCSELLTKLGNIYNCDVLNGIALDTQNDVIYVTGKLWDKMFTIKASDYSKK